MQKVKIDAKTIQKTVKISQAIEGYKSADKKIVEEGKNMPSKYRFVKSDIYYPNSEIPKNKLNIKDPQNFIN